DTGQAYTANELTSQEPRASQRTARKGAKSMLSSPFFTFAGVFIIAFAMPILAIMLKGMRIPTAVLEILCGIAVGRSGWHLIPTPDWMNVITKVGLLFLMFLAGLEIRSTSLRARGDGQRKTGIVVGATLLSTAVLAIAAALFLSRLSLTHSVAFTALILATTSLGIVVPILKERGQTERPLGQTILLCALFADFATVFFAAGIVRHTDTDAIALGRQFVLVLAEGGALYAGGKLLLTHVPLRGQVARVSQLGVRGALAMMAMCGGMALAMGSEVILGGFVAGFVCSLLAGDQHEALRRKLEVLGYSLFLPLFFITVGMQLDLRDVHLQAIALRLPILIGIAFAVKMLAALPLKTAFTWRETLAAGAIMSTRFTLVMAVAVVAARHGVVSVTEEGTAIAMALATVLVAPILFAAILHDAPRVHSAPG
ncbi:MAG: cation:proton antiporter, partial [Firmicutes bacterium]|nr:cation:proton antiporter [Bacillota bacterium]